MSNVIEQLILVDETDRAIGEAEKKACHLGSGKLHRAFSIFIFNSRNELLIQKRSNKKMLWPDFWSNSCCSHPRKGESLDEALQRRLMQELKIKSSLSFLFNFTYQAKYLDIGSENEFCHVFFGRSDEQPMPHPDEVSVIEYLPLQEVSERIENYPDDFTPWFKIEWHQIINNHLSKFRL
jgi:isopentenyl-diphosphate Delta-isomerase